MPERAILIQEQTPTRNVDSKTCAPRFDYCEPKARRRVLQHNRRQSGRAADLTESTFMTRSRHRAEAFQIEAQAGPGSGIPPAKMSQRVSLSDGEGLLPSLCSDEPRAERTDQRVRQRVTHRVRDFVFAASQSGRSLQDRIFGAIFIDRERHGGNLS